MQQRRVGVLEVEARSTSSSAGWSSRLRPVGQFASGRRPSPRCASRRSGGRPARARAGRRAAWPCRWRRGGAPRCPARSPTACGPTDRRSRSRARSVDDLESGVAAGWGRRRGRRGQGQLDDPAPGLVGRPAHRGGDDGLSEPAAASPATARRRCPEPPPCTWASPRPNSSHPTGHGERRRPGHAACMLICWCCCTSLASVALCRDQVTYPCCRHLPLRWTAARSQGQSQVCTQPPLSVAMCSAVYPEFISQVE